jgi:hypothetical protein
MLADGYRASARTETGPQPWPWVARR